MFSQMNLPFVKLTNINLFLIDNVLITPQYNKQRLGKLRTHIFVFAVEVSHSPTKPIMSSPVDSWLKNLG